MPSTHVPASAATTTYDGFYLRNSLQCTGAIPSPGPYDLCPDIIQSPQPIPNAQSALSTQQSWAQTYSTDPAPGATNYYYVRGINGAAASTDSRLFLYCAPSQLLMFPSSWKNNVLPAANGLDYVGVETDPGHIGVGNNAFVWKNTPVLAGDGSYYGFVAQVNDANNSNPIPTVTSWLDMGILLSQNLGFGFRNTSYVDGSAATWYRRLALEIPQSIGEPGNLVIGISASGFTGGTVGFVADLFSNSQQPIMLLPTKIVQDGALSGINLTVDPGFATSIAIQSWNTSGNTPAPGSSITISVNYVVPNDQVVQVASQGLLNSARDRYWQQTLNVGPQQWVVLGSASFVVANPPS